ncbi:MAG TPA: hypothetical protein VJ984_16575 [Xanthomonadales bacterium]|nr:hypothetical protein [Xanthomonadales bacterium]
MKELESTEQQKQSFLSAVLGELSRRKVLRTVGGYAVGVFVLLQLMDAAVEPLRLPAWLPTFVVVFLILGFPVVFVLAWQLDITSEGVKRTKGPGLLSKGQNAVLFSFMMVATAGLGYTFYEYYSDVFDEVAAAPGALTISSQTAQGRTFSAPENSIAVLPFTDLTAEMDQGYFADGISEEILNLLAQVDGLQVAARTSSFAFREPDANIREIGRLLNVGTVLEGSVRTSGNRVRLTAQLINVEDGFHIWSQSYDREMSDIFVIQDEVASEIARALVDSFTGLEASPASRADNLAAAEAYRTGRLMWWRRTPEDLQGAAERFAEALQHDPTFAPAYAALADTWLLLALYGNVTTMESINRANPMIERALEADPNSAEAHAALGLARSHLEQNDAAESALRHAISLNPNYVPAQLWLSTVLESQGRYPEQQLVLEKAMELDPLNELLAVNFAGNLSIRGEADRARELLNDLIAFRPDSTILLRSLAGQEMLYGNLVEGFKLALRSHNLQPEGPQDISTLAQAWLVLNSPEDAERVLMEGLELHPNNAQLQNTYWQVLLATDRLEQAASLSRQWLQDAGENTPPIITQMYNTQMGMLSFKAEDLASATEYFSAALQAEDSGKYDGFHVFIVTMAAMANKLYGNTEEAERLLTLAQRDLQRAKVNGVNNPDINYTEAVILAMSGRQDEALSKLRVAYEAGFRVAWLIDIDPRVDSLRDHPEFIAIIASINRDIKSALEEVRLLAMASL